MGKKLLLLCVIFGSVFANGYELNGDLKVLWTGYKTESKVGVSGTFKKIDLKIKTKEQLDQFLQTAEVTIDTVSFDSGMEFRDNNIINSLFALGSAKKIKGIITNVDLSKNILTLQVTMNQVKKDILMEYSIENDTIVATGKLDVLDFNMEKSYLDFTKVCYALHEGKSYSEVAIKFILPFKK